MSENGDPRDSHAERPHAGTAAERGAPGHVVASGGRSGIAASSSGDRPEPGRDDRRHPGHPGPGPRAWFLPEAIRGRGVGMALVGLAADLRNRSRNESVARIPRGFASGPLGLVARCVWTPWPRSALRRSLIVLAAVCLGSWPRGCRITCLALVPRCRHVRDAGAVLGRGHPALSRYPGLQLPRRHLFSGCWGRPSAGAGPGRLRVRCRRR